MREEYGTTTPPSFRELFDANASYVWSSLRRLGVSDEDRDDLVQEVFLTVHALLEDYDPTRPVRPWLFAIAYRIVLRHRRRTARAPSARSEPPEDVDPAPSAEAELVAVETRERVRRAIASIELSRRAVFLMKEVDGVPVPEIAVALGLPLNTAYSRLRLAREDFRAAIERTAAQTARKEAQ